jgi:hypothetical protein
MILRWGIVNACGASTEIVERFLIDQFGARALPIHDILLDKPLRGVTCILFVASPHASVTPPAGRVDVDDLFIKCCKTGLRVIPILLHASSVSQVFTRASALSRVSVLNCIFVTGPTSGPPLDIVRESLLKLRNAIRIRNLAVGGVVLACVLIGVTYFAYVKSLPAPYYNVVIDLDSATFKMNGVERPLASFGATVGAVSGKRAVLVTFSERTPFENTISFVAEARKANVNLTTIDMARK